MAMTMHCVLGGLLLGACVCTLAAPVPMALAARLYTNPEMVHYVCPEPGCKVDAFALQLDATPVRLRPGKNAARALRIMPVRMGHMFPTALFVREGRGWRMVYSPNVASRGVSVLPTVRHGYYLLREHEPTSREDAIDTDYAYDPQTKSYGATRSRCFAMINDVRHERPCD